MALPRYYYQRVTHITPAWLAERNLSGLIVDLDNTVLPRYTDKIPADIADWAASLKAAGIPVVLLSNNHRKRVTDYAARLGFFAQANAVKPLPFGYWRALRRLGLSRHAVVMAGDQFFTDIIGAALVGITSVMVLPLSQQDLAHTLLLRKLEKLFLRKRQASQ
jgi:HAD superfamily phosphatase (TIGR01668 family)